MLTIQQTAVSNKFRDQFLSHFPTERRSRVVNMFLDPVRRLGVTSADMLVEHIRRNLDQRIREAAYWRSPDLGALTDIRAVIEARPDEARRFALWAIAWASLPGEVRDRAKAQRAEHYRREWMAQQQPTDRQLAHLRRLGYQGPPPANRAEASELIDRLTKGDAQGG